MNNKTSICSVPWKSILIDTNKDLKPCCNYARGNMGNLHHKSVTEILSGKAWTTVKEKLNNNEWPEGCETGCKVLEDKFGWSARMSYEKNYVFSNDNKLNYIEFNGSNICNLACLHCSPKFSSKWLGEWTKLEQVLPKGILDPVKKGTHSTFLTNPDLILKNLKELDLSDLRHVAFKGGDPMLNDETLTALKYFDEISILDKMEIQIVTNGTIIDNELILLLNKAKRVILTVSVDGIGKLNEYIRYGNNTNTEQLKKHIEIFSSSIKNLELTLSVSIMVYNIFNLVNIREYWQHELKNYNLMKPFFNIVVVDPPYLNPCVLSFETRTKLIEYYTANQIRNEFDVVIQSLAGEYLGDDVHNNWVRYTAEMEKLRGNSILDIVPELKEELQYK